MAGGTTDEREGRTLNGELFFRRKKGLSLDRKRGGVKRLARGQKAPPEGCPF